VEQAAKARTIDEARCDGLGQLEEDCRVRWVQAHADRAIEELLAACETDECRFVALDWNPVPLREQHQRCGILGVFKDPCRVHALVRYLGEHPSPEAQWAEIAALGPVTWMTAKQLGIAASCGIRTDCAMAGEHAQICASMAAETPSRGSCDVFRPNFPLPTDKAPTGRRPGQGPPPARKGGGA
jgi:hypothetical protein